MADICPSQVSSVCGLLHGRLENVFALCKERVAEPNGMIAKLQAEKEAALIPKGMRILPDEERLEMVAGLEASKRDVEEQIQVQPKRRCMHQPSF